MKEEEPNVNSPHRNIGRFSAAYKFFRNALNSFEICGSFFLLDQYNNKLPFVTTNSNALIHILRWIIQGICRPMRKVEWQLDHISIWFCTSVVAALQRCDKWHYNNFGPLITHIQKTTPKSNMAMLLLACSWSRTYLSANSVLERHARNPQSSHLDGNCRQHGLFSSPLMSKQVLVIAQLRIRSSEFLLCIGSLRWCEILLRCSSFWTKISQWITHPKVLPK